MTKTFDDFFVDNEVKIGIDFQVNPPIYYQSLDEGLYNYFSTITYRKQKIEHLIFGDFYRREDIGFSFNDSDVTVFTILNLHRFFELLLKDLLGRIDPFLAVKFLDNENQIIELLNNSLEAEDVQTIEFSEALRRFKAAIKYAKKYPCKEQYQFITKFTFLIEEDTMQRLASWRNRITHNGKILPNILALDYLVTQKVIPLVSQILSVEKEYIKEHNPHYFKTPTGINLLEQFLSIKFDYRDFYKKPKPKRLKIGLLKIAHLKAIAHARYYFDPLIINNASFLEPYYDNPLERCLRFAESERSNENFHDIKTCLCCGIKTLVVYKKMTPNIFGNTKEKEYYFSRCTSCNYLLPENMGDPFELDLYHEPLFGDT